MITIRFSRILLQINGQYIPPIIGDTVIDIHFAKVPEVMITHKITVMAIVDNAYVQCISTIVIAVHLVRIRIRTDVCRI